MKPNEWQYKPNCIQIELVQGCNRNCSFCGTAGMEKKFYFASRATIEHTCNLIKKAELNCRILLAGHGEPTIHPKVIEAVRLIRKILPKNTIHMFTNGTIIEKRQDMVIDLFEAGLNDLVFDEYSDHRLEKFITTSDVCQCYEIVKQGSGTPLFAEKDPKSKRICIVPPIDESGNTVNRKIINHCGAGAPPLAKPYQQICSIIFRDMFIRYDGNIAICCNDFRGDYYVTNINKCKTLEEAWLHPRLESARKFIYNHDRSAITPCNICNDKPIRAGLLPDSRGQTTLSKPTSEDRTIVSKKFPRLAKTRKREWEK